MKTLEQRVKQYLEDRNWHELRPVDMAKSIMIEGAELLEVFQWDNLSHTEVKQDQKKMEQIRKELADVLLYCLDMAVVLGIDTEKIVLEKIKKVEEKYPAHLFKEKKKDPGTEDIYWKIKEQYRREGKN